MADALLSPSLEAQKADSLRVEKQQRERAARQGYAWFGLAGFAIGAVLGYALLGNAMPMAFAGLALGFIAGNILARRAA
ncbi:MAG: hypothetical protein H0T88_02725 [Lysobacter sp.]|nr:hypothetical protein [Lysobacter sp.]